MTQDITPPDGDVTPDPAVISGKVDISTLPPAIQEYIKDLRGEARKANDAKKEADKLRQTAENTRLENDKQWQTLAEDRKAKLSDLEPKVARLDEMNDYLRTRNTRRIEALPKQHQ